MRNTSGGSLKTKLLLIIGSRVILILLAVPVVLLALQGIRSNYNELASINLPIMTSLPKQAYLGSRISSSINELIIDLILTGDADETEEIEEDVTALTAELDSYRALVEQVIKADAAPLFQSVEANGRRLIRFASSILELDEDELTQDRLITIREEIEAVERAFVTDIEALLVIEEEALATSRLNVAAASDNALRAAGILFAIIIALILPTVRSLNRLIVQPFNQLMTFVNSLKAGDLAVRSQLNTTDEFGQLAQVLNHMADTIQEKIQISEAARARAERSDAVKSAFLASMSHELRTPLNSIINFTRFVVDGDTGPVNEQQAELLTEVIGSSKHLLALINDVLDMSKIEAGSLNLFVEDNINLKSLLDSAVTTAHSLLNHKPVRLHTDIADDLPLIRGDKQRILQIMLNLLSNACKFTEEGDIHVRARRQGDEVLIAVADTGPGIAPEDQALVFEPFKQTSTGLRQAGGTGLGMPIARNLAQVHGGRLWLESTVGQGTTFYVTLPVRSDELQPVMA